MPQIRKDEQYVNVGYELCCGYERATALADQMMRELKNEPGIRSAEDKTNGFYPDNRSLIEVTYLTLADANRLDKTVREMLSRKADFTYTAHSGVSYGQRGASMTVRTSTTLAPK